MERGRHINAKYNECWVSAFAASEQTSYALGNKKKALAWIIELLCAGKLRATASVIILETDDRPASTDIPDPHDLRIRDFKQADELGEALIYPAFWVKVFSSSNTDNRALWKNNVFSDGCGSQPLYSAELEGSAYPALFYPNRSTAYNVHFDQLQLDHALISAGVKPQRVELAREPHLRAKKVKGANWDWDRIEHLSLLASAGRLQDQFGPLTAPSAKGRLIAAVRKCFADMPDEPSQATLYRRVDQLISVNENRRMTRSG